MDGNRLIEEDYSPRPTYHALRYLIKEKLRTQASGKTDAEGRFAFHGFHGIYRLTVKTNGGKTCITDFVLKPEDRNVTVPCNL